MRGHGHGDGQTSETIDTHLVDQVDGGQGFDAEHAVVGAHRGHGERGIRRNINLGAKLRSARTQGRGVSDGADRACTGRERLQRVFFVAVLVLDRLVVGADEDGFSVHFCTAANLHIGSACDQVGHQSTTAGKKANGNVESLGVKVLIAVGDQVKQTHIE